MNCRQYSFTVGLREKACIFLHDLVIFPFHSWPEFLNFLDLSQQNAQKKCPALCDAPRRVKSSAPVTPSPIDELSEETKSRLVSKLRKKVLHISD